MAEKTFPNLHVDGRVVADLVPDAISIHENGIITFVNQAAVRLMGGLSSDDLVGRPVEDFVHPDFHQVVRERLAFVQRGRRAPLIEQTLRRLDGSPVDVEIFAVPVSFEHGAAVVSIGRDITERKTTEAEIKARTEELEQMNRFMVGRELKMIELKKKVERLEKELELLRGVK